MARTIGLWVLLTATLGGAAPAAARNEPLATLKVLASAETKASIGQVRINGKEMGRVPLTVSLRPGRYLVEAGRAGQGPWQSWVDLRAGEVRELTVILEPTQPPAATGALLVAANVAGAEVWVDGRRADTSPALVAELAAGRHQVEVRAAGHETLRLEATVVAGQTVKVQVTLRRKEASRPSAQNGALRVTSQPLGAYVFVDGTYRGKTPLLRQGLDPGPHIVRVAAPGYAEQSYTVEVRRGVTVDHRVALKAAPVATPLRPGPAPAPALPRDEVRRGLSSFGAQLVPPRHLATDLFAGFPYFLGLRATTGFFGRKHVGMDGGIGLRSYGAVTEFGVHSKLRLLSLEPLALGVLFEVGGGGGPSGRNNFYLDLGGVATLAFRRILAFTARAYFDIYSDRHCPGTATTGELGICVAPPTGLSAAEMRRRFVGLRFMLSAAVEVAVSRWLSLFLLFEGPPFQPGRRAFTDAFAGPMPVSDPGTYLRLGVTFKL